ncbi:hypothetical protein, unlikely [Trypanosoma brucei gambiense DAL972]|uniref:Uncharacterized protein n=1 Tax=Trypanosoma brucei gambiense (strain MHOM/CI/86/DAL972) TaxID=679716 RepID=C9ZHY1_TRYB9|nr:hypothetical protein, unlikely [Trypanosoma brucei gambiense DAL972]CBH09098.1 hypothetical protein, unlikely [Trypanosoma brucei gambiense DAL972]|eukprot:XP_011771539.1 hypothetical protein, unlikely [Trypanosoma brucei gambiense DAL972]
MEGGRTKGDKVEGVCWYKFRRGDLIGMNERMEVREGVCGESEEAVLKEDMLQPCAYTNKYALTHTHTHACKYIYIYIYIYTCAHVCVCVCVSAYLFVAPCTRLCQ